MESHADFAPGKAMVKVGNLELEVRELGAAQRDAIVRMIGEKMESVNTRALLKQARELTDGESGDEGAEQQAGPNMIDIVLEVFSGMLTDADCVVLDTPANRQVVSKKELGDASPIPSPDELPLHDKYGCEMFKPLWAWVRANITTRQELELVRKVVELNDFVGLGKNLAALLKEVVPGFEEGESQQTTPAQ